MDKSERSTCPQQRALMGKGKSMLRSPAACVPVSRLRSNQDDEGDGSNDSCHVSSSSGTTGLKTMQRSTPAFDPRHEAATAPSTTVVDRSKSVVVLRRCEDLNIRTGGFQKIEEAAHRLDIRRPRQQPQQSPARQEEISSQLKGKEAGLTASKLT
ncbi:hypothetical protein PHYPSEUDO_001157 [Phytophthora pseudosyringae]|uniref:Uncharacterized protein n=1 Tax=Phytophthora pseudosyringae TaxID=221518 RepID=A0A8T1W0K8_9STRA|nr:hypothetical protein PHYPSEUDO_001157 [Phytophthora pseudosyringae]